MKNKFCAFLLLAACVLQCNGLSAQTINTFAGNNLIGYVSDGVPATSTSLFHPWSTAVDAAGNVYIADLNDQRIRKVAPSGIISTVAGVGSFGYSGDGGPATNAQLYDPYGIAVDAGGNLYIAEFSNHIVRKVSASGFISTIAGTGTPGFNFDGIPATASELNNPKGVAVDGAGNVYVADYRNTRIRKINTSGIISTVAGDGSFGYHGDGGPATAANLFFPAAVAIDGGGSLYIADENNNVIRKVAGGIINTVAGNGIGGYTFDGVPATATELFTPEGISVDAVGNMFIAEFTNQRIRKVNTLGIISTIAGNGTFGFSGDGGPATASVLGQPTGVTVDGAGNVFIADELNNRVRKVYNPAAIAPITGITSLCIGGTTTLSDASTGGTWTSGNTAVATIGSGTGVVNGISAGTSSITYSLGGGSVYTTVTVSGLPVPGIITGPATVCVGSTATLTDPVAGGTWSAANTNASVAGGVVTGVVAGPDVISYTVTNSCGSAFATMAISVNPFPVVGGLSGPSSVCVGASISLTDATSGGIWGASNTDAVVSGGGVVTGVSAGIDTITYSITNSCGTGLVSKTITVISGASAGIITGPTSVCQGAVINLSDAVLGGLWSATNPNAYVSPSGAVTGMSAGTDTIIYTVSGACGTASAKVLITIVAAPVVSPISGPTNVCVGASVFLSDITPGGNWTSSNTTVATIGSTGTLTGVVIGTATVTYKVTNLSGCSNSAFANVNVATGMPSVVVLPYGSVAACDSPVVAYVVSSGPVTYQWLLNNTIIPGATNISYKTSVGGNYSVTLTSAACSETMPGPIVLGRITPVITFTPPSTLSTGSFITYEWYLNGKFIPGATSSSIHATTKGNYTVLVVDANLCHDTSAVYVMGVTGVNNISNNDGISVFPDPAASVLNIDAPVKVSVAVLSLDGRVLITQKEATAVNISSLTNGLYLVMIYDENNLLLKTTRFAKLQ